MRLGFVVFGTLGLLCAGCMVMNGQQARATGPNKPTVGPPRADIDDLKKARARSHELAMFAAGWFWSVEAEFRRMKGVVDTAVGYSGGKKPNVTYAQVCGGTTGHAEAVVIEFDPKILAYSDLVNRFYGLHNPTQVGGVGVNYGDQYRSAVYFYDDAQKKTAEDLTRQLNTSGKYESPVVTKILPVQKFWMAEEYHQRYYEKGQYPYWKGR